MKRFSIEHLPRNRAAYQVTPVNFDQAGTWLAAGELTSLVRTTELIGAINASFGVALEQSDTPMTLQPGDEALLLCLSYSVLLAWAQGEIVPLAEDWRCLLLEVIAPSSGMSPVAEATATADDVTTDLLE